MSYIKCKDLSVGYDANIVSREINFNLDAGNYLCIVGENGAGKSTLMKTMLGLIPKLSGELEYGENLSKKDIGYLPQQTLLQKDFPASVWEIVLSGHIGKGNLFYNKKQKQTAKDNMEYMGGQKQRVLLARALCATSKVILLDEPVTGLDPKVTTDFYNLVKKLNDDGISIIMVSHDIDSSTKYASHILHIAEKQLFFGETKDYMDSQAYKIFGIIENSR